MNKLLDRRLFFGSSDGPIPPEIRALANPAMLAPSHVANFELSPELDEAKGLIDALRKGEGIDALLARHEEVMREFLPDAVYDHKDQLKLYKGAGCIAPKAAGAAAGARLELQEEGARACLPDEWLGRRGGAVELGFLEGDGLGAGAQA